jgi:hypothetical protein
MSENSEFAASKICQIVFLIFFEIALQGLQNGLVGRNFVGEILAMRQRTSKAWFIHVSFPHRTRPAQDCATCAVISSDATLVVAKNAAIHG